MGMGVPQNKKRVVEGANMNKLCLLWTLTAAARTRLGVAYWARPINRYSPIPVRVHPTMQLDPKLDRKSNDSLTFFFFSCNYSFFTSSSGNQGVFNVPVMHVTDGLNFFYSSPQIGCSAPSQIEIERDIERYGKDQGGEISEFQEHYVKRALS